MPRKADDWAAILFTSGSEGVPKGVVLSHRNMLANAAQAAARIDFGRQDKVFNVLPVFHSFGLTVGVVLPLVSGVRIYLYPSPLHYRTVAELIYGVNATIMFGTDTFLSGYARVAHPYDFRSLRYILAGAEPVKESTRKTYMEKFGLRILEGYGVTETAPALALNTPMFNKFGTVGRILPGMEARLEKVEGVEEGGRLFVRGPNVMLGYLKVDNPGVLEPPAEGWHDTGDIVTIDAQGFVTIKGRAKRFAKVGGEMISLAAVEMLAGDLWPNALSAVVAVPDPRKGERLILVTQQKDATRSQFQAFARDRGASELMMPSEVMILDKMPLLGSGKVDLVTLGEARGVRASPRPKPAVCRDVCVLRRQRFVAKTSAQVVLPPASQSPHASSTPNIRASATARWRGGARRSRRRWRRPAAIIWCSAARTAPAPSVQWLTQWPVTAEAVGVFTPGKPDALFVQWVNHAPLARKLADRAEVAWGGESSIRAAIAALEARGARADRVGVIGPMNFEQHAALAARFGKVDKPQPRLCAAAAGEIGGGDRLAAHRRLAQRPRHGGPARRAHARAHRARARRPRRARLCGAGRHQRHPLHRRDADARSRASRCRRNSPRPGASQAGDIVFAEISAAFWEHPGQVLRSFAVGAEPPPLYRALHAAADAAFDAIAAVLQARRDAGAGDRGFRRDRGGRLHHHRRSAARLRRRLFAADPRQQEPPRRADPGGAVRGRHDGGDPAQRGDARRQGRRADRRDGADHGERHRAAARVSRAGLRGCDARLAGRLDDYQVIDGKCSTSTGSNRRRLLSGQRRSS